MDNHNEKENHSMMWMMLPCLLILVFFVVAGGVSFWSWPLLALVGIMVGAHLWMMFRSHGHKTSGQENHDNATFVNDDKGHSNHSGCH